MAKKNFLDMSLELLNAIPDITELRTSPGIFFNNLEDIKIHNCSKCMNGPENSGDEFEPGICRSCWANAMARAYEAEKDGESV